MKRLIIINGPDGSGKSTIVKALAQRFTALNIPVSACYDRIDRRVLYPSGNNVGNDKMILWCGKIGNPLQEIGGDGIIYNYTIGHGQWINDFTENWIHSRVQDIFDDLHL